MKNIKTLLLISLIPLIYSCNSTIENNTITKTETDNLDYTRTIELVDRPGTYTDYTFNSEYAFYNLDIYSMWDTAPSEGYIFPAFQFFFQANEGGYIGMQLVGSVKKAIFSIWDISEESAQPISNECKRFTGEGNGAQCIIDYPWITGQEYRLRIWALDSDATSESWIAAIQDTKTQIETTIGIISLKNSNNLKGYGWLRNDAHTFVEYFGGAEGCDNQPYSKVFWRGPYANSNEFIADNASIPFYPNCDHNLVYDLDRPTVVHENGGNINKLEPKELWKTKSDIQTLTPIISPTLSLTQEYSQLILACKNNEYVLSPGDTLNEIALLTNTPVNSIVAATNTMSIIDDRYTYFIEGEESFSIGILLCVPSEEDGNKIVAGEIKTMNSIYNVYYHNFILSNYSSPIKIIYGYNGEFGNKSFITITPINENNQIINELDIITQEIFIGVSDINVIIPWDNRYFTDISQLKLCINDVYCHTFDFI